MNKNTHAAEPIADAGRRIIHVQFEKMLACADAVRVGDDVEAVHDMRVATRRIRSALRLLRAYYARKNLQGAQKPLRALARRLGAVRDLDVLIENARAYADELPLEQREAIEPLMSAWLERRRQAQHDVRDVLDGKPHKKLKAAMRRFLKSTENHHAPRVCDAVPLLVWQRYVAVRAYESCAPDAPLETLHALRIQCKRLRYTLEFFADVMGDMTPALIKPLVALQDTLGALHDADVARQQVAAFIAQHTSNPHASVNAATLREAAAYLSAIQKRMDDLRALFLDCWQAIVAPSFRQALAGAVAAV